MKGRVLPLGRATLLLWGAVALVVYALVVLVAFALPGWWGTALLLAFALVTEWLHRRLRRSRPAPPPALRPHD